MTSTVLASHADRSERAAEAACYERRRAEWDALLPSLQAKHLHQWVAIRGGDVVAVAQDLLEIGEKVAAAGFALDDVFIDYVRDGTESYILWAPVTSDSDHFL